MQRALLFGINYKGNPAASLSGCVQDANNVRRLLVDSLGFREEEVMSVTDDSAVKPTRSNMLKTLSELVLWTRRKPVDRLFISYSGHGTTRVDDNGDEVDGGEEALVPLDYMTEGYITDDELGRLIRQVHPRTDCVVLIDACHSGTALDFPFRYISGNKFAIENDEEVLCRAVMISGCRDSELAQEVWDFHNDKRVSGLMTSSFLHALQHHGYDITCFKLIKYMQDFIVGRGETQKPQLCTTRRLSETCAFMTSNVNSRPFFVRD